MLYRLRTLVAAWLRRHAPAPGPVVDAAPARTAYATPRETLYRGHQLEQKRLLVGWQVAVTRQDAFVWNGNVTLDAEAAMAEARAHVDCLLTHSAANLAPTA